MPSWCHVPHCLPGRTMRRIRPHVVEGLQHSPPLIFAILTKSFMKGFKFKRMTIVLPKNKPSDTGCKKKLEPNEKSGVKYDYCGDYKDAHALIGR
ncbi:hypothetical protein pdam_00018727 [Pocillopora damicornis]|uniref:Uncharacterized protein n=1 Tax=Pocillopora damicornis TaxID=46731 RepID=A0A3M6UPY0_POCDA|nr:hypothetical protein pdam_00018727 [Pocillopora damicornis]